ncbi:MAG: tRNA (adenosine(37)-N6)-threonylcarbamoyltransferase complex dimerization subunit type 1 TsaB [Clostridia bacterium]|nr:tRNA (adenosine(37)-N6)-threonylcarbamoyltransferase complex dimerization subunit type 1 TsaB [Clostridia bacterium]
MRILAIDTTGPALSAAVSDGDRILCEMCLNVGLKHSQTLMPAVDQVLERSGLSMADIDLAAVVAGPGSFTGVRIGVCAVKGLCCPGGQKAVALDALEVLAAGVAIPGTLVAPVLDARRGQVYCALFSVDGQGLPVRRMDDAALPIVEFLSLLPEEGSVVFTGDGLSAYAGLIRETLGSRAVLLPMHLNTLRAAAACRLASARESEAVDAAEVLPIYARAPQAVRERLAREEAMKRGEG